MPQLLLELFSEEIPARMQKRAEEDLARLLAQKLEGAGLKPEAVRTFSSPRHLGAVVENLPAKAADVSEERKGPRVGAPEAAIAGFLRGAGLASIEAAEIVSDKKGDFYVARIERAGRATAEILAEIVPEIVRAFPWPKSMRSGTSELPWVRPLHNILCVFDGAHVAIDVAGVPSEHATWGHRFHAPDKIVPRDYADHYALLREAKVLIDREERKRIILEGARALCAERKLELVEDAGLLEEVAGLVEWPVVLMGRMDEAFLDLPAEVIRLSMRTHQKYFAVRDPRDEKLAPHFITVANVEAKDGGDAIAAGNARVLSARLNDARFFWDGDRKSALYTEERRNKLAAIVFHQKLGSVWDKVERVRALAKELCAVTGADEALVDRAAMLCKCDLVTETVGEFPELQGQIGRELAALQGEDASVCAAIEDHYRPLGPNDRVPSDPVAVTLALADKLDTLVGFWRIDETPTGSSDPYALRRAALGFIRILIEGEVRADLEDYMLEGDLMFSWRDELSFTDPTLPIRKRLEEISFGKEVRLARTEEGRIDLAKSEGLADLPFADDERLESLHNFLVDRIYHRFRAEGIRHDVLQAAAGAGIEFDLVLFMARVEALDAFLRTEDGANLLAGYKRAANILAAEEKKGKALTAADIEKGLDVSKLEEPAEKALYAALEKAAPAAAEAVKQENFTAAMAALASLRAPVDSFFDEVLVNAENELIRTNRLLLLSSIRGALHAVADFSRVET